MVNISFFLAVFFLFCCVYFFLGCYASSDHATNEDYFLASRTLGLWATTFTLIATQLGGGMLLGTSADSYHHGWYGMIYSLGIVVGFFILASGFAGKMRAFNIATMPQLFFVRYGSIGLQKAASFISAAAFCGISMGMIVASRSLLVGLGAYNDYIFLFCWTLVIFHVVQSGLKGVVVTDTYQVIFITTVFMLLFGYSISQEPLSFFSWHSLKSIQNNFSAASTSWTGYFLMPLLFSLIEQDLAQRFFAAKTQRHALGAAFIAGIVILLITCIPVYFGIKARLLGIVVPQGASPLIVLLHQMTNDVVMAFVVCAIMAAIISTADSLLCAAGSLLAQDFNIVFRRQHHQVLFSRCVVALTGLFAFIGASYGTNILEILTQSYELVISSLFIPLVWCYFTTGPLSKVAAILAFLGGICGFIFFRIWPPLMVPREIASLFLSGVGYCAGLLYNGRSKSMTNLRR